MWLGAGAITLGLGAAAFGGGSGLANAATDGSGDSASASASAGNSSDASASGSAKHTDTHGTTKKSGKHSADKPSAKSDTKPAAASDDATSADAPDAANGPEAPKTHTAAKKQKDTSAKNAMDTTGTASTGADTSAGSQSATTGTDTPPTNTPPADDKVEATVALASPVTPQAKTFALAATSSTTSSSTIATQLAALLHAIQVTFFNHTPTATVTGPAAAGDGTYTGKVIGNDADGDPLLYSINLAPTQGTVIVDASGDYTYTPDTDLAATGGTDTFQIAVQEANAASHIHGLTELIYKNAQLHPIFPPGAPGSGVPTNVPDFSGVDKQITVTVTVADGTVTDVKIDTDPAIAV